MKLTDVHPVQQDPPRCWVINPRQQSQEGRFARSVGPQNRNTLAKGDRQRAHFDSGGGFRIKPEFHPAQFKRAGDLGAAKIVPRVVFVLGRVGNRLQPVQRRLDVRPARQRRG